MRHRGSNGGSDMRAPAPNALTEIQRAIARALPLNAPLPKWSRSGSPTFSRNSTRPKMRSPT
jgi:hypothetical protein